MNVEISTGRAITGRITRERRVLFAVGGVATLCLAAVLLALGFALSGLWPGISWAIGAALALVAIAVSARWLRAAMTGQSPGSQRKPPEQRGAI